MNRHATLAALGGILLSTTPLPLGAQTADTGEDDLRIRTEEVRFEGGTEGVMLAGTVTLPEGPGPFPAAILLTVAGPDDRNQTMPDGSEPFRTLAEYLARRGVATLRADDRGVGGSTGDLFQADAAVLAADALAAVEVLRARPEVDPASVGAIGNSEGALVGSVAAARDERVAFVVMLGGAGARGSEIILQRALARLRATGGTDEQAAVLRDRLSRLLEILEDPGENARERLRSLLSEGPLLPPYRFVPDDPEGQIDFLLSPWYRSQLFAEPSRTLSEVQEPVLAITGSRDRVNPADQNLPVIHRALTEGSNPDFTVAKLPGLDHFMRPAAGTSSPHSPTSVEGLARLPLVTVGDWILARFPGAAVAGS